MNQGVETKELETMFSLVLFVSALIVVPCVLGLGLAIEMVRGTLQDADAR